MSSARYLLPLAILSVTLAIPSLAEAGKKEAAAPAEAKLPVIEATGISEFDSVFMRAKDIHTTIDTQTAALNDAKKGVNAAAKVADNEPLDSAMNAIKAAAAGNLDLDNGGPTPRVKAKEGAAPEVKSAANAVNKLADAAEGTLGVIKDLIPEARNLATACIEFPAKLLKMEPSVIMTNNKKVTGNVKTTAATTERLELLQKAADEVFTALKAVFAA